MLSFGNLSGATETEMKRKTATRELGPKRAQCGVTASACCHVAIGVHGAIFILLNSEYNGSHPVRTEPRGRTPDLTIAPSISDASFEQSCIYILSRFAHASDKVGPSRIDVVSIAPYNGTAHRAERHVIPARMSPLNELRSSDDAIPRYSLLNEVLQIKELIRL